MKKNNPASNLLSKFATRLIFCPACGQPVNASVAFCPHCGKSMRQLGNVSGSRK